MKRLAGKVALVTGSSRGIGAAIARRLSDDGAKVVVNYVNSAKTANDLAAELGAKSGQAIALQADVSDAADVKRLFAGIKQAFGHVDIVVNNAGVFEEATLEKVGVDHFRYVIDRNVLGTFLVASEAIGHFPATGGRIVNLSSVLADSAAPGYSVYGASKAAVAAATRYWAIELGPRQITVNAVAPGVTETDMAAGFIEQQKQGIVAGTPLGRIGQPADIADVVAFLASNDARWVTGQSLTVSGGFKT